jgi:hypothetical protein
VTVYSPATSDNSQFYILSYLITAILQKCVCENIHLNNRAHYSSITDISMQGAKSAKFGFDQVMKDLKGNRYDDD